MEVLMEQKPVEINATGLRIELYYLQVVTLARCWVFDLGEGNRSRWPNATSSPDMILDGFDIKDGASLAGWTEHTGCRIIT